MSDPQTSILMVDIWRQPKPFLRVIRRHSSFAYTLMVGVEHGLHEPALDAMMRQLKSHGWTQDYQEFRGDLSEQRYISATHPCVSCHNELSLITVEQLAMILRAPMLPLVKYMEVDKRIQRVDWKIDELWTLAANAEDDLAVEDILTTINSLMKAEADEQAQPDVWLAYTAGIEVVKVSIEGGGDPLYLLKGSVNIKLPGRTHMLIATGNYQPVESPADGIIWHRVRMVAGNSDLSREAQ